MAGETVITVVGNLVADPELRFTASGAAVAKFTVASTPRTLDRASGECLAPIGDAHRIHAFYTAPDAPVRFETESGRFAAIVMPQRPAAGAAPEFRFSMPVPSGDYRENSAGDRLPAFPDDYDTVTAAELARAVSVTTHLTNQRLVDEFPNTGDDLSEGDRQALRRYTDLVNSAAHGYGVAFLLRAFAAANPVAANAAARELLSDWQHGEAPSEQTWEWLREYGVDPEKVISRPRAAAGAEFEKADI